MAININLNNVQEKLVSGTNIKTVNGTSLLGSGNISTASGFQGTIVIADTPTTDGIYRPTEEGTYTNAGGLTYLPSTTDEGFQVEFFLNGGVWVKSRVDVSLNDLKLQPYISNVDYLKNIDKPENFYTTFNGVDSEINLNTPVTLSSDGDFLEIEFYVEDFGTNVGDSLSLGVIGELGTTTSVLGYNSGKKLYVRDTDSNWLSLDGINSIPLLNENNSIRLEWNASDISVFFNDVFQKNITKGDFIVSNIGHAYNYLKGGISYLKIHNSLFDIDVNNITLLSDANFFNTEILRKPNTLLELSDIFDNTNTTKAVSGKQVFENTISSDYLLDSNNLIDFKLFEKGNYFVNGVFSTLSDNWISIKKMNITPNTQYSLSGFGVIGSGGRVVFFDANSDVISLIEQTTNEDLTFTTPLNCHSIGITIANEIGIGLTPQDNVYVNTLMLNLGNMVLPFEPFEPKIDGNKVQLDVNIPKNDIYYEFDLTANSGQPKFTVYVPIGGNKFAGFKLALFYDMSSEIYADIWRIYTAELYSLVGESMSLNGIDLIVDGESEFVYRTNGKSDHTGGVHGDETLIDVGFYADGFPIDINNNIPLTKCSDFYYIQNSNLHTTDDLAHTVEAEHYKKTIFNNNGYTTKNRIKTLIDISFTHIYHGISCVSKSAAIGGHNELNIKADFTGTTSNFLTSNAREFNSFNVGNKLTAFVTSELKNPITDDYGCEMFVWDRATDSKYYRKYNPGTVTSGNIIESKMTVKFNYSE